jgi:pilus assembly protein CpaB
MQSRTLKIIAALLIISAVVMGVIGYKISQEDAARKRVIASSEGANAGSYTYAQKVIIANRDISTGETLTAEDVQVLPYPVIIDNGYDKAADVVNKTAEVNILKGAIIRNSDFEKTSALSPHIRSGYRSLAVKVDEVIGSGGFLKPGDFVDVIFTSRAGKETYNKSLSRRILRNVRVLAFGSDIETDSPKLSENTQNKIAIQAAKSADKNTGKRSRSAVLEVTLEDINKLVLAENSGVLRLIGIGEEDTLLAEAEIDTNMVETEDEATLIRAVTGLKPPPRPKSVYVYSGDKVETIRVSK